MTRPDFDRSRYYNRGYGHAALYNQSILANEMLANQLYTTQMMTPGMAYVDPYRRYSTYNRYLYSGE